VTSRAATLANAAGNGAQAAPQATHALQAVRIAQLFAQQAKRRMANNLRRVERNEDMDMNQLAGFILDKGRYPWDVT
jgi:hypothetical protein